MNNKGKKLAAILTAAMVVSATPGAAYASMSKTAMPSAAAADSASSTSSKSSKGSETTASTKISKSKAEQLSRQLVSIPKEYTLQGASLSTQRLAEGKQSYWSLDFVKQVNGKHMGSINTSVDANTGQLINFNSHEYNPAAKPTYPLKVDRDKAQELASTFIEQIAPDYKANIQYNTEYGVSVLPPLTGEVRHSIRYDRVIDGIPYMDNFIEVQIDSEGHVKNFTLQWDDTVKFPKLESKLSFEEAGKKLRSEAKLQLKYILPYNVNGKTAPYLSYEFAPFMIDAVTGNRLTSQYDYSYRQGTVSDQAVTAKPLGDKPKFSEPLTEEQAIAKAEAAFQLPAAKELRRSSYNENTNSNDGSTSAQWHLNWSLMDGDKEIGSASATVDAHTGAIINYYNYGQGQEEKKTVALTLTEAIAKAEETIKKQLPWLTHELYIVKPDPKQYENYRQGDNFDYYISFVHKVHGAVVDYDNINVGINAYTGKVSNFDAYVSTYSYPVKTPALLDKNKVVDKWMDFYRVELTYRLATQYWWNGQPIPTEKFNVLLASGELKENEIEQKSTADLVYRLVPKQLDEHVFLDAQSGEWRTYDKAVVTTLVKPKATDIDGHWAEKQLELMVAYKALDLEDGKVSPNAQVTRGELIKMLVLARNSGGPIERYSTANQEKASFKDVAADSAYFAYVESALEQNLIDVGDGSFNPEGKVSRDDMAELIVRALGYNTLAQYEDIFKISFKDSGKVANKGQAAIVVGLKLMNLTDGKFQPEKQVTRAEAASAFFRYLQARADLQEAPLRM